MSVRMFMYAHAHDIVFNACFSIQIYRYTCIYLILDLLLLLVIACTCMPEPHHLIMYTCDCLSTPTDFIICTRGLHLITLDSHIDPRVDCVDLTVADQRA